MFEQYMYKVRASKIIISTIINTIIIVPFASHERCFLLVIAINVIKMILFHKKDFFHISTNISLVSRRFQKEISIDDISVRHTI